ncbi:MAG: hypothetical protein DRI57_09355 [Deltaproteobacteria bacterium]|nr:MAG: hypothetical protein DRI57_09355 [Deltaproteobacteria bacterium]
MAVLKRTGMDNPVIWSFVLDDMISNFSGSLVPGACSLKVESNYRIDGFSSFNIAGTFGAGAEARYYSGKVKEGAGSLFFPYVLQGVEDTTGFTTGIAISSLEDEIPADAYCKLTLTDSAGNVSIYERTSMGKGLVWTFVLDSQMSNFAGTLLPGPCQLKVESNFAIDGFLFINVAGTLGYGSLATIQEGVTGDINADDKIGLEEAIHALKVVSGVSVSK